MASPLFRIHNVYLAGWKTGSREIVGLKMAVWKDRKADQRAYSWVRRPQTSKVSQLQKSRKPLTQFKSSNLEICDLWNCRLTTFARSLSRKDPSLLCSVFPSCFLLQKKYKASFCVNWRTSMCFFSKANWQAKTREKAWTQKLYTVFYWRR